jgi:hypothetical protein
VSSKQVMGSPLENALEPELVTEVRPVFGVTSVHLSGTGRLRRAKDRNAPTSFLPACTRILGLGPIALPDAPTELPHGVMKSACVCIVKAQSLVAPTMKVRNSIAKERTRELTNWS